MEIKSIQRDIVSIAADITAKQHWSQKILSSLHEIRKSRGAHRNQLISRLETEIIVSLDPQRDEQLLQEKVQDANAGFLQRIERKFPFLTDNDLELCCFIRMNFPNAAIAALKHISIKSVNMARHRLKKKLTLDTAQNLDEFIKAC
jgi:hypothetical protein